MGVVRVQSQDFDAAAEARALKAGRLDVGAIVTFVGLCRDEGGRLTALEIEHYPGMAEAEIARVVARGRSALAAHRRHRDPSLREAGARRPDRARRRRRRASRRSLRGGGNADGLSQDPGAVLEARAPRRRLARRLGRSQGERRSIGGALARRLGSRRALVDRTDRRQFLRPRDQSAHSRSRQRSEG